MGLLIYPSPSPVSSYSVGGLFTNPLSNSFDGTTGNVLTRRYYVRNDASDRAYTGITLQPVHTSGTNVIDGTNGYHWKLIVGDSQPLDEQWDFVAAASSITIPDIGTAILADTSTYQPFWLRQTVPKGAPVESHSGIVLRLDYTELLVP